MTDAAAPHPGPLPSGERENTSTPLSPLGRGAGGEGNDAATRIESAFSRIAATSMAGLPLNNPVLHVEAVGFDDWQGLALGVLIAPWSINLILLPNGSDRFRALALDEKHTWRFPSGEYEFMGGHDDDLGPYQFCSLFSPAFEFASQDEARAVAVEVLAALRRPDAVAVDAAREPARPTDQPLSRRGFLRGGFLGGRG